MHESTETSQKDTAHIIDAIRQKQSKGSVDLLTALGVTNLQAFDVTSTDAALLFRQKAGVQQASIPDLITQLQICFEKQKTPLPRHIKPETFFEFTLRMLEACGGTTIAKEASLNIFEMLKDRLSFNIERGVIKISFPQDSGHFLAPLFNAINADFFSVINNSLHINLKRCFESRLFDILWLRDKNIRRVFLNPALLSPQKVFFISEALEDGNTKVTPVFRTDNYRKTPAYHIILDISSSMNDEGRIGKAKKSVLALAQLIFSEYPHARIQVSIFADYMRHLNGKYQNGYSQPDFPFLEADLKYLAANGDSTGLYGTTCAVFQQYFLYGKTGNNTLLLTDGLNNDRSEVALQRMLDQQTKNPKLRPEKSTNKLSVISFGVEQPELMKQVSAFFNSSVITLQDADFAADATISQFLATFVHYRALLLVQNRVLLGAEEQVHQEEATSSSSYLFECELDGGLVQAESQILKPGTQLEYKITDHDGSVLSDGAIMVEEVACTAENSPSSSSLNMPMHGALPHRVFPLPIKSSSTQAPLEASTSSPNLSTPTPLAGPSKRHSHG